MKSRIIKFEDIMRKNPCIDGLVEYEKVFGKRDVKVQELIDWGKYYNWICRNLLNKKDQYDIINSRNSKWICFFAQDVKGVDIAKLQEAIINSGSVEYMCYFAKFVNGANVEKLGKKVKSSGNIHWINYFLKYVQGIEYAGGVGKFEGNIRK